MMVTSLLLGNVLSVYLLLVSFEGLGEGGFPESVFSVGNGFLLWRPGSLPAVDVEEVLSGACDDQLYVLLADVIKSFDTVDG